MFAHAWFQHRSVFWAVEGQTGLYIFFKTVCDHFKTLQHENFQLPPEAEGLESTTTASGDDGAPQVVIEKPKTHQPGGSVTFSKPPVIASRGTAVVEPPAEDSLMRTNTRRHIKSSPSVGSALTTVPDAEEEDGSSTANMRGKSKVTHRRVPELEPATEEEMETDNIPVIVYHGAPEPEPHQPVSEAETTGTKDSEPADTAADTPAVDSQQPETENPESEKPTDEATTSAPETVEEGAQTSEDQPKEENTADEPKAEAAEVNDDEVGEKGDEQEETTEPAGVTANNEVTTSAIPTLVSESEDSDVDTPASSSGSANDDPIGDEQESDKNPTTNPAPDAESEEKPAGEEPTPEPTEDGPGEKRKDNKNATEPSTTEGDSAQSDENVPQEGGKKSEEEGGEKVDEKGEEKAEEKDNKDGGKEDEKDEEKKKNKKTDKKAKASPAEQVAKAD